MSLSIFNIETWNSGNTYNKEDIVELNGYFFYSLVDGNNNNTPAVGSNYWGGLATDTIDGINKPIFIWKPNYDGQSQHNPKVDYLQFGDGYSQRIQNGINNDLITLDYTFEKRSTAETTAILHFLHARSGKDMFLFTVPPPYNIVKRFICRQYTHVPVFRNNHSIRAQFIEVPF